FLQCIAGTFSSHKKLLPKCTSFDYLLVYLSRSIAHAIPLLFMSDIVYGYKTVYPIPLGMGSSWNPDLIEKAYQNTAEEAYAGGTQVAFAPMVDLVRDARWGRVLESTGEDPYLNSRFATAMVRGFQHDLKKGKGIVSCVKHFAAYGAVEAGREYNSADMSLPNLYQNYLPSYHAAVDAGAKMVMTSLTTLNGVPATADKWLLNKVLREQWGFKGIVISDYASVYELTQHGFAKDSQDAADKALDAGIDIDMKSPCYANGLKPLLEEGHLSESKLNEAVWRVLSLKNELGLFEDPYRGASHSLEQDDILTDNKRQTARQVSRESMVLLKNDNNILPLDPEINQKIALIGPYANERGMLGLWAVHGDTKNTVTIEDGILEHIDGSALSVEKGTDIIRDKEFLLHAGMNSDQVIQLLSDNDAELQNHERAISAAKQSDLIIFACGEHTLQSGEAGSRTKLRLPTNQQDLFDELVATGKKIITIVISGRPLVLTDVAKNSEAVIEAWFPGTEGGHALADILFGDYNPSGRLSMSFPYSEAQYPIYYNHLATGRPEKDSQHVGRFVSRYTDAPTQPLFPFGYGLSYGTTHYGEIQLSRETLHSNETVEASIEITYTGILPRDETVQMYLHDCVASVVQPVKRLIDFQKIHLDPNSKQTVSFEISSDQLGFYDQTGSYTIEPGDFDLFIGKDSNNVQETQFTLV
ncbi:beta-glucosidase BglX, partial [Lapidilactobacillus mulanensis]|uniref:beta-glucosidase BglX n=2 Tax=Lapidilactobacillus mulanensis TaxID=2485999 RepID=UPI0036D3F384